MTTSINSEIYSLRFIAFFFIADIAISFLYIANIALGDRFTRMFDLDGEANFPAWYSSTQLFVVAALLGLFAFHHFSLRHVRSWPPAGLAMFFVLLSADETAQFHEWAGSISDALLTSGTRETLLDRMGTWMFVIGLPGVALAFLLLHSARFYFRPAPGALVKFLVGMAILAAGAVGVEGLDNFLAGTAAATAQVFVEETLEMVGVTIMLWGTLDLLQAYGLRIGFDRTGPP
ncbi:hypothetical protein SH611_15420 [Geminicoccaceae bacterium 1502E]|nr:hypothetical protein [Geminicoccaceae bacterium 1502E]